MNSTPVGYVVEHAGWLRAGLLIRRLRDGGARVGYADGNHVFSSESNCARDVELKGRTEPVMLADECSIDEYSCTTRGTTKAQGDNFLFPVRWNWERPAIPGIADIVISNDARSFTKALSLPTAGHLNDL